MDIHYLEVTELADHLRRRDVTSVAVTRAQLDRIERLDGDLASYARITAAAAFQRQTSWHRRHPLP